MAMVLEVLRQQRQQLQRLVELRGVRRLGKVYAESRAELRDRLAQLEREGRGQSFSAHHMRIMLLQAQHSVRYLEDRLGRELEGSGRLVAAAAPRGMYRAVQALEQHFSGHAPVAQVEQAALFQRVYRGVEPSLLDRFRRSKRLYGPPVVEKIRLELAKGLVQGKTVDDMVSAVAGTGGIFDGQRWRAERIVRTELAYAHNVTQYRTLQELSKSGGPTHKKLVEVVPSDGRTGEDSLILHGQIRRVDEPFHYDPPAGKKGYPDFLMPPGRPNDRAVVIPWRLDWDEKKAEQRQSPIEVVDRPPADVPVQPEETAVQDPATLQGGIAQAVAEGGDPESLRRFLSYESGWALGSAADDAVRMRGAVLATLAEDSGKDLGKLLAREDAVMEAVRGGLGTGRASPRAAWEAVPALLREGAADPKMRATLEAMSKVSQRYYDQEYVTLYRGVDEDQAKVARRTGKLPTGALVSFTEDPVIAGQWARAGGGQVFEVKVRRKDIVASHRAFPSDKADVHSPGVPSEQVEVIVRTRGHVRVERD